MRFIVTGFDAFGGESTNPSQLAVERLPDKIDAEGAGITVTKQILATCCQQSWNQLEPLLSQTIETGTFVLMCGLASKRSRISMERFALNIRDYRIADNQGHQPADEPVIAGGPDARKTSVRLSALLAKLQLHGYLIEISNFAGAFVCNDVYYRCLAYQENHAHLLGALFVHLPPPAEYAQELVTTKQLSEQPDESAVVEIYSSLLQDIAKFCCDSKIVAAGTKQG